MKHLKIAGLCLVSTFVICVISAPSASALLAWQKCAESSEAGLTKWENDLCSKASATGKFQWREITATEKVTPNATVAISDTNTLLGTSEVECGLTETGSVGPGRFDRIETVKVMPANCRAIKVCENVEAVEARNLPWQTELFETEGKQRDKIAEGSGGGEPGWKVTCKTIGGSMSDECLTESGKEVSMLMKNMPGGFVNGETTAGSSKGKCSQGGKEAGGVREDTTFWVIVGGVLVVAILVQ